MPLQFALLNTLNRSVKGTGSQISKSLTEMDSSRTKEVTQHSDFIFVKSRKKVNAKRTLIFAKISNHIWSTITH
jgi:hypothetical protein